MVVSGRQTGVGGGAYSGCDVVCGRTGCRSLRVHGGPDLVEQHQFYRLGSFGGQGQRQGVGLVRLNAQHGGPVGFNGEVIVMFVHLQLAG